MNVSMGAGLLYIAAWSLVEFIHFFRVARTTSEHVLTGTAVVLYAMSCTSGAFTILEAVGHWRGWDLTTVARAKAPLTMLTTVAAMGLLGGLLWLRSLWRRVLTRALAPELAQLRTDLLNLSAAEAELHLDLYDEAYANRVIVEAVDARCRAAGLPRARRAIARLAASLLTLHRANVLQDPGYGLATSWDMLMEEAAAEIDQAMAATAWERALRDAYVYQHVYGVLFLVLDRRTFRDLLLLNERPRLQPWHEQVADLIATVMHEHGHPTPRSATLAHRGTAGRRWTWRRALGTGGRRATTPPAPAAGRPPRPGNLGND